MNRKFVFLIIASLIQSSCSYEDKQKISGEFYINGEPAIDLVIGLASWDHYEQCQDAQLKGRTDMYGTLELSRTIHRSRIDPYVHKDSLCIKYAEEWEVAWSAIYGPAPETIEFKCVKNHSKNWTCLMNDWNGE